MKLLAIDTTEAACSAALLYDRQIIDRFILAPRRHSELVLPMMDELLHEAGVRLSQLDALAFARGPGSFTGVRIACAVVQGAATAADLPVVPVSSLLALAQGVADADSATRVLAGFDARMQEVYWAQCVCDAEGLMRLDGEEQVCPPQSVPPPGDGGWLGAGGAFAAYGEILQARLGERLIGMRAEASVQARDLVRLAARDFSAGLAVPAERALPVYLRDQVAKKPGE